MSTSWWRETKSQGITKIVRIHLLETMKVLAWPTPQQWGLSPSHYWKGAPEHCQQIQLEFLISHLSSSSFISLSLSRCFGEDTCITIPDIDAVVMVLQPSEPRITITGLERLSRPASDLRAPGGIALFQDLHIISTVTRADATAHNTGMDCNITVLTSFIILKASVEKNITYWAQRLFTSCWYQI